MPAIFSKNCIFAGELDSYCLVCSKYLVSELSVLEHIQQSKHKGSLNTVGYFEKFEDDCVRKVKGVYFCEFCNMTFPTAAKVGLHVKERTHLDRKNGGSLKRVGDTIVFAQSNVQISEHAWNGIIDEACVLCNAEFDDVAAHKSDQNHILNLINTKVIVEGTSIYRKIDGVYQCLTCNAVISDNVLKDHMTSKDHIKEYGDKQINGDLHEENSDTTQLRVEDIVSEQDGKPFCLICDKILDGNVEQHVRSDSHRAFSKIVKKQTEVKNCDGIDTVAIGNDTKSEVLDFVSTYYKKDINIDLIKEIIVCKKCSKFLLFDIKIIKTHMLQHGTKPPVKHIPLISDENVNKVDGKTLYSKPMLMKNKQKAATQSVQKEIENLAKEHALSFSKDENIVYCKMCNSQVTATVQNIHEHVAGIKHKKNSSKVSNEEKQTAEKLKKVPMKEFIKEVAQVTHKTVLYLLFNDEYFVPQFCYLGIAKFRNKIICQVCCMDVNIQNLENHITSSQHRDTIDNSCLLTSIEGEFVRQLKPELFDCVYCGKMESDWDDLVAHLSTKEHKTQKAELGILLQTVRQDILIRDHILERMIFNNFVSCFNNMRPF